jgi:HEAT repeat protein
MGLKRVIVLLLSGWTIPGTLLTPLAAAEQSTTIDAWDVLDAVLQDKSADKRAQAVSALGLMSGNGKAVDKAENALNDADPKVVRAAIAALGEMNSKASLPKIKALVSRADGKTVIAAAAFLKKFNDPEGYEIYYEVLTGKRKDGGGIFDGLKDKKALEKMGIEAAIGILPFGGVGTGAYDYLSKNGSEHSNVGVAAADALTEDKDPVTSKSLVQAAFDAKDPVQVASLRALARRGDPSVVDDIKPAMHRGKVLIDCTAAAAVLHLLDVEAQPSRAPNAPE